MNQSVFKTVLAALFAALMVVGAYIAIPFVPVPLVLANFFVLFAALMLGPVWGGAAVLVYLSLGALGLPVFAGGKGGFAHFATPTGGFLLGYLAAAIVAGFIARGTGLKPLVGKGPGIVRLSIAGVAGLVVMYAIGVPWFQMVLSSKFTTLWAAFLFMAPYLIGDVLKVAVVVALTRTLQPLVNRS